jgi:hypothetical protein
VQQHLQLLCSSIFSWCAEASLVGVLQHIGLVCCSIFIWCAAAYLVGELQHVRLVCCSIFSWCVAAFSVGKLIFLLALQPNAAYGLLIHEGFLITHNDASQWVGLL